MDWKPVRSRLISEVSYSTESEILSVRFCNGRTKTFPYISPATYDNLMTAESPGFYFSNFINNGPMSEIVEKRHIRVSLAKVAATLTATIIFFFTANAMMF